jgi:hypothetical protein
LKSSVPDAAIAGGSVRRTDEFGEFEVEGPLLLTREMMDVSTGLLSNRLRPLAGK